MKGTVRLKLLLLTSLAVLLANPTPSPSPNSVTQAGSEVRSARLETEEEETELVRKIAKLAGTIKDNRRLLKAYEPEEVERTTTDSSSEESEGPTIECAYFDESRCKKEGECAITKRSCGAENHLKAVGCLAIFDWPRDLQTNSTEEFLKVPRKYLKSLGCMQYQHADSMNCHDDHVCRQGRIYRSGIGMCCCTTDNCNNALNIEMRNPSLKQDDKDPNDVWPATSFSMADDDKAPLDVSRIYWLVTAILALVAFCGFVVVILAVWKCVQKKRKKTYLQTDPLQNQEESGRTPLVDREMIEMKETPKKLPISDLCMITQGRFGKVYRGTWTENGETRYVAVKKFDESARESFDHEKRLFDVLNSLPKLYPAVLKSIGSQQLANESSMVVEFHERLSLFDLLKASPISKSTAVRFILSMLDGLQYLHDDRSFFYKFSKPAIIHRDIKSKNVLVKRDMTTCIADFGLARVYDFDIERSDLLGQVGTRRYMSPEMLEGATEFTANAFKAMDVYSMGLVAWEVVSRIQLSPTDVVPPYAIPFEEVGTNPAIGYMRNHIVTKKERPRFRAETLAHEQVGALARVTEEMWESEAFARITAGCAFSRVWDCVLLLRENSEGYHSGGSMKERNIDTKAPIGERRVEEIEDMAKWHADPDNLPYPTPDPFLDFPPPPPIPLITERGYTYSSYVVNVQAAPIVPPTTVAAEPAQKQETKEEEELEKEKVFDVAKSRLLKNGEQAQWKAKKGDSQSGETVGTETSTPTPESSSYM